MDMFNTQNPLPVRANVPFSALSSVQPNDAEALQAQLSFRTFGDLAPDGKNLAAATPPPDGVPLSNAEMAEN
jgi:hypothetical protein